MKYKRKSIKKKFSTETGQGRVGYSNDWNGLRVLPRRKDHLRQVVLCLMLLCLMMVYQEQKEMKPERTYNRKL